MDPATQAIVNNLISTTVPIIVGLVGIAAFVGVIVGQIATANSAINIKKVEVRHTQQREFVIHVRKTLRTLIDIRADLQILQKYANQDDPDFHKQQVHYGRASAILLSVPDLELRQLASDIMQKEWKSSEPNPKLIALDKAITRMGDILWRAHETGEKPRLK